MKILIVEDNIHLVKSLTNLLKKEGIAYENTQSEYEAIELVKQDVFDIVLLDIGLADGNGFNVIKAIRKSKNAILILVISSLSEVEQRVKGLNLGADDYLVKPFENTELLARINALSRRLRTINKEHTLSFKNLILNTKTCTAYRENIEIELRKKEFLILEYLLQNTGIVLSREKLMDRVWGTETDIDSNKIDVHVKNLRKKVDAPFKEGYIKTVRGLGYVIR